jgi:hypothetical protein
LPRSVVTAPGDAGLLAGLEAHFGGGMKRMMMEQDALTSPARPAPSSRRWRRCASPPCGWRWRRWPCSPGSGSTRAPAWPNCSRKWPAAWPAGDAAAGEARALSKQNQEALAALQAKTGVLEAKLAESQSQQAALDAMVQELTRNRDERLLAEIEQALNTAAQQLQLAGNVEAALIALQGADARLVAPAAPSFCRCAR